jgi:hypothetical protein
MGSRRVAVAELETKARSNSPASRTAARPPSAPSSKSPRGSGERAQPLPAAPQKEPNAEGTLEVKVVSGNTPVPGVDARLYVREPADLQSFPARWSGGSQGETGAPGRWAVAAAPGSYYVTARMQGFDLLPGTYNVSAREGEEAGVLRGVAVAVGQRLQGLSVRLGEGARIMGKVVRKDGSPVLGARVEVFLDRTRRTWGTSRCLRREVGGAHSHGAVISSPKRSPSSCRPTITCPHAVEAAAQEAMSSPAEEMAFIGSPRLKLFTSRT